MKRMDLSFSLTPSPLTEGSSLYGIGYGVYVVTTRENGKDSGLIVNTVSQVASNPEVIAVSVNHANHSDGVILRTGKLNVNILAESAPFSLIQRFGFQSGKNTDKTKGLLYGRSENNLPILMEHSTAYLSLKVETAISLPSHTLFLCTIEESRVLSKEKAMSYAYYHAQVKPKAPKTEKQGWVCKICGFVHPEKDLPKDFICPICKHPASDFEPLSNKS